MAGGRLKGLFGKDRVCAVVAGETSREMRLQVRQGLRKTRTLELRLDYLRNVKEREALLSWLRRKNSSRSGGREPPPGCCGPEPHGPRDPDPQGPPDWLFHGIKCLLKRRVDQPAWLRGI